MHVRALWACLSHISEIAAGMDASRSSFGPLTMEWPSSRSLSVSRPPIASPLLPPRIQYSLRSTQPAWCVSF